MDAVPCLLATRLGRAAQRRGLVMREQTTTDLGPDEIHDLGTGSLPLSLLEARTERWIAAQRQ